MGSVSALALCCVKCRRRLPCIACIQAKEAAGHHGITQCAVPASRLAACTHALTPFLCCYPPPPPPPNQWTFALYMLPSEFSWHLLGLQALALAWFMRRMWRSSCSTTNTTATTSTTSASDAMEAKQSGHNTATRPWRTPWAYSLGVLAANVFSVVTLAKMCKQSYQSHVSASSCRRNSSASLAL